jgi:MFS transporter, PAT family, solute carrier family 33 (acetyl-CoA transportor), member 1
MKPIKSSFLPAPPPTPYTAILWLLFLYTLQGIPLGMSAVFPLILKEKGASYSDLATYSLSSWPFALKLLWAPIVDSTRIVGFLGIRKSWLLISQTGIVIVLYILKCSYQFWVDSMDISSLTWTFFALYFLAATQDIAVDGWALTMLPESHVGYAGTCNSVGQTLGYFIAFSGFMVLDGLQICGLDSFIMFWVVVFGVGTVAVLLFTREGEKCEEDEQKQRRTSTDDDAMNTLSVYRDMFRIFKLKPILKLTLILLTWKFSFSDGLIGIKLQESGIYKESIAVFAAVTTPVHIILPWVITKCTMNYSNMRVLYVSYPIRVLAGLLSLGLVYCLIPWTGDLGDISNSKTQIFYILLLAYSVVQAGLSQAMFVPQMSFFSSISDPVIGGTYMTVLNTLSNMGGNISGYASLVVTEKFNKLGLDGFYVTSMLGIGYGLLWWYLFGKELLKLGALKGGSWKIGKDSKKI